MERTQSSTSADWRHQARSVSTVFVVLMNIAMIACALRGDAIRLAWHEMLIAWGFVLAVVSLARWSHLDLLSRTPQLGSVLFAVVTTLTVDGAALLFSSIALPTVVLATIWLTLGIHETWWLGRLASPAFERDNRADEGNVVKSAERSREETVFQMAVRPEPSKSSPESSPINETLAADPVDEAALDQRVQATMVRSRLDDGVETVAGMVRLTFEPGEQSRAAHLGFVPSMAGDPEVEIEQCEGPEATLRIDEARCYGARIDVRLPRPVTEPTTIAFEYAATATK